MQSEYRLESQTGEYVLRQLSQEDSRALAKYFLQMSQQTKQYYGPHPLNAEYANELCQPSALEDDTALRFVVTNGDVPKKICGYFIVQSPPSNSELERYAEYGMPLQAERSVSYAPSMAETLIGQGIGSQVFELIKHEMLSRKMACVVLMGGVQKRNTLAVHYYQKFGFQHVGSYYSDVENLDMILHLD